MRRSNQLLGVCLTLPVIEVQSGKRQRASSEWLDMARRGCGPLLMSLGTGLLSISSASIHGIWSGGVATLRRGVYKNRILPYLLVMPQVVVTLVFFFWPAFQSIRLSVLRVSPFGDRVFFVGFANYQNLFSSAEYMISVVNTWSSAWAYRADVDRLADRRIVGQSKASRGILLSYGTPHAIRDRSARVGRRLAVSLSPRLRHCPVSPLFSGISSSTGM